MARRIGRSRSDDPKPPSSLVASARRLKIGTDPASMSRTGSGWQDAAWHFFDTVGEYAYAVNWVGNLISRAKLYATYDDGSGPERLPEDHEASRYLDTLFYNEQGRSAALQQIGVHYTVAGEAYIVGRDTPDGECWDVVSGNAIKQSAGKIEINGEEIGPRDTAIRIWRPHPRDKNLATSPSRAALPILSEIERLTMHVAAQVDSRLASAGILLIPNEMSFAVAGEGSRNTSGNADAFVKVLQDVMGRAISNRDAAEALVPIVLTADGEILENVRHMGFWSDLDNQAIELRTEAIRRLALSMDMPPEILTGTGDASYRAAWMIDESSIKSHSEPLLTRVANDLATGYLRPLMKDSAGDDLRAYGVGVDTTEMRLRPNRSQEAIELHDRGILSADVLLEETGFKPTDIQSDKEHRDWFINKVASGQTQPEIVEAALRALGIDLDVREEINAPDPERPTQHEARPVPSLQDHPTRDVSGPQEAALMSGCEVLVMRALERAGNRLKNKTQRKIPGVSASDMYQFYKVDTSTLDFVLDDAWGMAEKFADRWGVDADRLKDCLDSYARAIILEQKPHDPSMMRSYINLLGADA